MSIPVTVALVDDHQLFRKGMAAILNASEQLSVIAEASNGHEMMQLVRGGTLPQVVLLDLEMPVMDGMQTLTALSKEAPETRVILLTMHSDDRFVLHFMESGAHGYLLKDAHPEEVELAIKKVAQHGFYFNDAVSRVMLKGLKQKNEALPELPGNAKLNEREIDVLKLICLEMTTQEVADKLFLSPRTIEGYRKSLLEKTGAKNTAGLVLFAVRSGLVSVDPGA